MKTIRELREQVIETTEGLESGSIDLKIAAEMNNCVGKIINTVRAQLEYAKLRKEKPQIDFLKCH